MDNRHRLFRISALAACVASALAFTGCGNHNNSHDNGDNGGNGAEDTEIVLAGQVIDGYISGARVCADLNQNFRCDVDEPDVMTDDKGSFAIGSKVKNDFLKKTPYACLADNSCHGDLAVRIIALSTEDSHNWVLGNELPLANQLAMSATFFLKPGDRKAHADSATNITPYTTLTDRSTELDNVTPSDYNTAFEEVAQTLGVNPEVARSDYNDPASVTDESTKALITGEVIARSGLLPESTEQMENMAAEQDESTAAATEDIAEAVRGDVERIISSSDGKNADIAYHLDSYSEQVVGSLSQLAGSNSDEFKCGVSKTHHVYCWGNNAWGNLGDPAVYPVDEDGSPVANGSMVKDNFSAKPVKVKVSENEYLSNVKSIDAGNTFVCAVTFGGGVYCWGSNDRGQLGNGKTGGKELFATRVLKGQQDGSGDWLTGVDSLTLGRDMSCALTRKGEAYCWGDNSAMQLGKAWPELEIKIREGVINRDGIDLTDIAKAVPTPVKVEFPDTVARVNELTAGEGTYCALVQNADPDDKHNLYCWGNDSRGLVSQHWCQYREDWLKNYSQKVSYPDGTLRDPDGEKPWAWREIVDLPEGSELKVGSWFGVYGQPVTRINSFITNDSWPGFYVQLIMSDQADLAKFPENMLDLESWLASDTDFRKQYEASRKKVEDEYTDINEKEENKSQGRLWQKAPYGPFIKDQWSYIEVCFGNKEDNSEDCKEGVNLASLRDLLTEYGEDNVSYHLYFWIEFPWIELKDVSNVTRIGIASFDSTMMLEMNNDSRIFTTNVINSRGGVYNFDWIRTNVRQVTDSATTFDGGKIAKLSVNPEDKVSYVLSDKGGLYGIQGTNKYGVFGIGSSNPDEQLVWGPSKADETTSVVTVPAKPIPNGSTDEPLGDVVDVSVGKRSVCAAAKVRDDKGQLTAEVKTYCWGSSTFGQLGFDNGDGGFSYNDVSEEWDGQTGNNKYLDHDTRMVTKPKLLDFDQDR